LISALVANDQFVKLLEVVAEDTKPESAFHVTDDTSVSSDAVPDTATVFVDVVVWLAGVVIDSVGGVSDGMFTVKNVGVESLERVLPALFDT
jgi:hypothetical protein